MQPELSDVPYNVELKSQAPGHHGD